MVRHLQLKENIKTAESLLGDLSGFRNFKREAVELQEEMLSWVQDTFDEWSRDIQSDIEDPHQSLRYKIHSHQRFLNY